MERAISNPEFEEYTYIIKGKKQFVIEEDTIVLEAGQSIKIDKNTRVQYSNPFDEPLSTLPYALLHLTLTKFIGE
jgi:mannose-6-phosphate isomerase-like protein (cupin superfamily)